MPVTPYVPQTSSHDATDGALSRASRSRSAATTPECQTKTPQTVATAANTVNPVRTQSTGPTRPTSLRITTTPPSGAATKRHPDKQPPRKRPRQAPSQPRPRNPRPRQSPASKTTPEPSHPREKPRSRLPHHDIRRQTEIRILPNLHRHAPATNSLRRLHDGVTNEIDRTRHDGLLSTGPQQARPYQHDADRRTRPRAGNRTPPKAPAPGQPLATYPLTASIRRSTKPSAPPTSTGHDTDSPSRATINTRPSGRQSTRNRAQPAPSQPSTST